MPLPSSRKDKDLPPALHSMWRALKRGYEAEPRLLSVSFGLSLLAALPDALLALWIKLLADGVIRHNRTLAIGAAIGLAVSAVAVSATAWRLHWNRTWPSCKLLLPLWLTTNGRNISTGWQCCAIRFSCSTTCSCRSSPLAGGSCGWA